MTDKQDQSHASAAHFFKESSTKLLTVDGRVHAETLIASVARMAGSLMYRSFGFDKTIAPGTPVFSDQANTHGPRLVNVTFATLRRLGCTVDEKNLDPEYLSTKFSLLTFKESLDRLAPTFLKYCEVTPMKAQDAAMEAAIAAGFLVYRCRELLAVDKGAAIAAYGFVEGTKTAPFPLPPGGISSCLPNMPEQKKPWYKLW